MRNPKQEVALRRIIVSAESNAAIIGLFLFGSWRTPAADSWSDLDLLAVLSTDPSADERALDWLPDLGRRFVLQQERDDRGVLSRAVYEDGLWLDVLSVSLESIHRIKEWRGVPFHRPPAALIACSDELRKLVETAKPTEPNHSVDQIREAIERAKFLAVQALKSHVRGKALVARHLSLELWQEYLVVLMVARELDGGFTEPSSAVMELAPPLPDSVLSAVRACDEVASDILPGYLAMAPVIEGLRDAANA
ncbi:MAG: hypothetical protein WDA27_13370 [Actinomycetota bacterium]